jgi:hypothetical protein
MKRQGDSIGLIRNEVIMSAYQTRNDNSNCEVHAYLLALLCM